MESIQIHTGKLRIAINDDPERVIEFNPRDVTFAERFYKLIGEFRVKQSEFEIRSAQIDQAQELDEFGVPSNLSERIEFMHDVCGFMFERIDYLFGKDTSLKVFQGEMDLAMIGQFFDGIAPIIQRARGEKIAQYVSNQSSRVMK